MPTQTTAKIQTRKRRELQAPKTPDEKIGRRIREARIAQGLTQDVLAAEIGVTLASISKKEDGAVTSTSVQLHRIAQALRKPVTWFLQDLK